MMAGHSSPGHPYSASGVCSQSKRSLVGSLLKKSAVDPMRINALGKISCGSRCTVGYTMRYELEFGSVTVHLLLPPLLISFVAGLSRHPMRRSCQDMAGQLERPGPPAAAKWQGPAPHLSCVAHLPTTKKECRPLFRRNLAPSSTHLVRQAPAAQHSLDTALDARLEL